jgi:hypothetical protein
MCHFTVETTHMTVKRKTMVPRRGLEPPRPLEH